MPYKGQNAGKTGHTVFIKNPDVVNFLDQCDYLRKPSEKEGKKLASLYNKATASNKLPAKLIASDASSYSELFDYDFPSRQVGYVKVSLVLVDLENYANLRPEHSSYVDPFRVAELHRNAEAIAFALPGSNLRYKNARSVADSFRLAVFEQFSSESTNFVKDGQYTLLDTLLAICDNKARLQKCPVCKKDLPEKNFYFNPQTLVLTCPYEDCNTTIYLTDILRLHEQVTDFGDCSSAINRFMNIVEHLLMASLIFMLYKQQPETLSNMAFMIDGPLAIFGEPAKYHMRLMRFYARVCQELQKRGMEPPVILGLQKTGQLVEHANAIGQYLEPDSYILVDDVYREQYVRMNDKHVKNFGHETYYGQDFIYKTASGKIFVFGVPYPFMQKDDAMTFAKMKADVSKYSTLLSHVFNIIQYFECDLYKDAVVPIALAHRHASISLVPGGKVLDIISRTSLKTGK